MEEIRERDHKQLRKLLNTSLAEEDVSVEISFEKNSQTAEPEADPA